jgi:hypothetical protein
MASGNASTVVLSTVRSLLQRKHPQTGAVRGTVLLDIVLLTCACSAAAAHESLRVCEAGVMSFIRALRAGISGIRSAVRHIAEASDGRWRVSSRHLLRVDSRCCLAAETVGFAAFSLLAMIPAAIGPARIYVRGIATGAQCRHAKPEQGAARQRDAGICRVTHRRGSTGGR